MADDDNTPQTETEQTGPGTGAAVAAGTGVGYAAALGTSHLIGRKGALPDKIAAEQKKFDEAEAAYKTKLAEDKAKPDSNAKVPHDEFLAAEVKHIEAEGKHNAKLNELWNDKIKAASPEEMKKLRLANLEGQVKHLEAGVKTPHTAEAIDAVKAQIEAVKKVDIKTITASPDAHAVIEKALGDSYTAKGVTAEAHKLVEAASHSSTVMESMKKADSKIAEELSKHAYVTPLKEALTTASTDLAAKKTAWETLEKQLLGTEVNAKNAAKKTLAVFGKYEEMNAPGIMNKLTRPAKMLWHGSNGARFAIGGATVLGVVLGVNAVRAMRNKPDADVSVSYTDRVTQERQDPTKTVGGASPSMA